MTKKILHKIQAGTLALAIILLWYSPGLSHNWAMGISSSIVGINALIEFFG